MPINKTCYFNAAISSHLENIMGSPETENAFYFVQENWKSGPTVRLLSDTSLIHHDLSYDLSPLVPSLLLCPGGLHQSILLLVARFPCLMPRCLNLQLRGERRRPMMMIKKMVATVTHYELHSQLSGWMLTG